MSTKISGALFILSAIIFAITAVVSKTVYYYGLAIMCAAVGVLVAFSGQNRVKKERHKKPKGKFQL